MYRFNCYNFVIGWYLSFGDPILLRLNRLVSFASAANVLCARVCFVFYYVLELGIFVFSRSEILGFSKMKELFTIVSVTLRVAGKAQRKHWSPSHLTSDKIINVMQLLNHSPPSPLLPSRIDCSSSYRVSSTALNN